MVENLEREKKKEIDEEFDEHFLIVVKRVEP